MREHLKDLLVHSDLSRLGGSTGGIPIMSWRTSKSMSQGCRISHWRGKGVSLHPNRNANVNDLFIEAKSSGQLDTGEAVLAS